LKPSAAREAFQIHPFQTVAHLTLKGKQLLQYCR
jgi:hypothetical protein